MLLPETATHIYKIKVNVNNMTVTEALFYAQASSQSHSNPHSSVGVYLDHWAVCSGSRGEGVCLPVRHCQCVSGERQHEYAFSLLKSTII